MIVNCLTGFPPANSLDNANFSALFSGYAKLLSLPILALAFMLALPVVPVNANDQPRFIESYRDWNLYTFEITEGPVCYIASRPTKEEGNYTRRGAAAVLVTKWPMESPNEEVSVQPGYTYLGESAVEVKIDSDDFELFTRGEQAWATTSDQDSAIIASMKKGRDMTVRGTSTKKTFSLDSYSLLGFTAAYQAMNDACS